MMTTTMPTKKTHMGVGEYVSGGLVIAGFLTLGFLAIRGATERVTKFPPTYLPLDGISLGPDGVVSIDTSKLTIPFTATPIIRIGSVLATGSMTPLFSAGSELVFVLPSIPADQVIMCNALQVGSLATYKKSTTEYIIHQVEAIKYDSEGRYFRFKGYANPVTDSMKVRDEDIVEVVVAVIY
jgi:signal peptidase I